MEVQWRYEVRSSGRSVVFLSGTDVWRQVEQRRPGQEWHARVIVQYGGRVDDDEEGGDRWTGREAGSRRSEQAGRIGR